MTVCLFRILFAQVMKKGYYLVSGKIGKPIEMRLRTSHTYDEDVALNVVEGIPQFLQEAIYLVEQLTKE